MKLFVLLAGAVILTAPIAASAANARNPYGNIDRRNDAGNDTGDSLVPSLNQAQLDSNGIPAPAYAGRSASFGYAPPMDYAPEPAPRVYDRYPAPSFYAPAPPAYDYRGYYGY